MKLLSIFNLLIFFLLNANGFDSFSQEIAFTLVPPPGEGSAWTGTQDPKGYMWFGGIGVHRYDGYSYKSYFNDPQNPSSLAADRIEAIWADRYGFIWVGTNRKGLDRLDPETGIFIHYRHNPSDPNSLSSDTISAILEDRDGKIWVGTEHAGLNCLDPKTGIITRFKHNPYDANSLSYNKITALYEDHDGIIWVGTGFLWNAPPNLTVKKGGLNRFNAANKNFTRFLHNPEDSSSLIDNRVRAIFEDSKGRFWVGTSGDGFHSMNRKKGTFRRHRHNSANPNGLSRPPVKNTENWVEDMISFVSEDATGAIWIGTLTGGLNRFDPETRKIGYYTSLNEKPTTKNEMSQFVWSYVSKDGVLWIGSWNRGIYTLDPFHKLIPNYDVGTTVRSMLQDSSSKLWLGTDNGLIVFDSSNNKTFVYDISNTMSLSGNLVNSIVEDRSGTIWIGTAKGLNSIDPQSQKLTRYPNKNGINVIYEDSNELFWLGTNKGLVLANRKGTNDKQTSDTTILSQNSISCIEEDKAGYLWIGSNDWGGLDRFDKKNGKILHYLSQTSIQSIFEDRAATLWIGTNRGLYNFKPSTNSFETFTNQSAGLTGFTSIYHILEDDQQSLWINTSIGLFRIRHNPNEVIFFGNQDANAIPIYSATQAGCYKGNRGELFFSNNLGNGYYAFFPEQLTGNTIAPELHITGFRLGDQLVKPEKGSPLSLPISQTKEIRLPYNQNVFSFDFAGLHYSRPDNNRHLFMLENLDNDWRKAGEEKTAYYYNVPPGNYLFRVKAANSDGVWAEKSIAVVVSPPWWTTWWAFCIYGLLLTAGVFAIHRVQKKRVIRAERERTKEKELAQAKEIEKAYTELKSTQAQLVQSEKMASLGELTAGIAHEIQNPLNFVNNFSEVSSELIEEMKMELTSNNHEDAIAIADDLKQNLDKINHHGKRADAIVKSMLQHSRSSSGVKELTDINALVDEYLRLAYHGLRAKDNSFHATMKTDFDETIGNINVIPQDIGRVILNLISNAFYAVTEKKNQTEDGYEPTVSVSTKKIDNKVEVRVRDNGNGIPPKVLDKIFQPFFTTKPTGQGTGLGLSLSYDIVKAHGGELEVERGKEGEGSEFVIRLPF